GLALLLAGQLRPLHVGPDLLRHLGRPDRRAAEDGLGRVLATLEGDRVPSERLLPLRHDPSLPRGGVSLLTASGVFLPHVRGEQKEKTPHLGACRRGKRYPAGVWDFGAAGRKRSACLERGHHVAGEPAELLLELLRRE